MNYFIKKTAASTFCSILMQWHQKNPRNFPWIKEKDPYRVWLSEIILQQTRVMQGLPYYEKMIRQYPAVCDLAHADETAVFRSWQGLGYYNRCKNMLATARQICHSYGGHFPDNYEEILELPGIGEYTAAAIASFAFGLPYAVVDGNVQRVLARYFGINQTVDTPAGKKYFKALANELLDKKDPAAFNQGIMDFGATVCVPRQPDCHHCLLRDNCSAYNNQLVDKLPVKTPKRAPKSRFIHYFILSFDGKLYIHKRKGKDIWQNLHEFIFYEKNKLLAESTLRRTSVFRSLTKDNKVTNLETSPVFKHQLTHQTLYVKFFLIRLQQPPALPDEHFFAIKPEQLNQYAFPQLIVRYFETKNWLKQKKF